MPLFDTLRDQSREQEAKVKDMKNFLASPKIKKILSSIDYLAEKYGARVTSSVYTYGTNVYFNLKDLNGLKDESLAELLYSMEHHGATSQWNYDDARSYCRQYVYSWDGMLSITIVANFKSDSDTCKRVIVGFEEPSQERKPIYELQCSDNIEVTETNEGDA